MSGKTVSDFLKIHTFLMFIFKTIFNENHKKLQALKLAFKSFSSKMSKLAIFSMWKCAFQPVNEEEKQSEIMKLW